MWRHQNGSALNETRTGTGDTHTHLHSRTKKEQELYYIMIYVSANLNTIFGLLWENCLLIHHIHKPTEQKPLILARMYVILIYRCACEFHFYEPEADKWHEHSDRQEKVLKFKCDQSLL